MSLVKMFRKKGGHAFILSNAFCTVTNI